MNTIVAILCTCAVIGAGLYGAHVVLGQWNVLFYAFVMLSTLFAVCKRLNA